MGIRLALGATRGRVMRMMLKEQLVAVALGLSAGAVVSAWSVRYLRAQLYAVDAYDPGIWFSVALAVIAVATVATIVPSRRAAGIDPVHALRAE
jgi:ABC-type antimicrobial peptide transport system permease subunit